MLSQAYQQLGDEEKATLYATFADQGQKELTSADEKLFALLSQPQRSAKACYELGHILLHKQSRLHGVYWLEAALKIDEGFIPAHQDMITFYTRTNQPQLAAVHQRYIDRLTSTDRPNNTGGKNGSGASDPGTTQNPTGSSQP